MANEATISYDIRPTVRTGADVLALVSAVSLPTNQLEKWGVTLETDTSVFALGVVTRTIVFTLLPKFNAPRYAGVNPQTSPFRGFIVSSSPFDAQASIGLQSARILYSPTSPAIVRKEENASLNGTTKVPLLAQDKRLILGIESLDVGSSGGPVGRIGIYTDQGMPVFSIVKNYQGSIFSTSEDDKAGGIGAHTVDITYFDDVGGGPFLDTITLNGSTPVNSAAFNHGVISNMTISSKGSANGNLGTISFVSGLNGTGGLVGRLDPSFYAYFPQTTDQKGPFRDLFTHILGAALQTKVTVAEPIIT